MGSREENKREKRLRILETTERLIREKGGTNFNMRELAREADVGFTTPFSLFGSKGEILTALLHSRIRLNWQEYGIGTGQKSFVNQLFSIATQSAEAYVADPELFRPLLASISVASGDAGQRSMELGGMVWRDSVAGAMEAGDLDGERELGPLSRSLHAMFRGALWRWAVAEISDEEFQIQVQYGTASWLLSACTDQSRSEIEKKRNQFEKVLARIQKNKS